GLAPLAPRDARHARGRPRRRGMAKGGERPVAANAAGDRHKTGKAELSRHLARLASGRRLSIGFSCGRIRQRVSCVGPENPKPGIEGITRWNASTGSPPCVRGFVSASMTFRNYTIEPGQPWVRMSRRAPGLGERTWRKCLCGDSVVAAPGPAGELLRLRA